MTGFFAQCDISKVYPCCSLCPCVMPFINSGSICPCMKRACLFIPSFLSPCPRYAESCCPLQPLRCRWCPQGSFILAATLHLLRTPSPCPVPASGHHQPALCLHEFEVCVCVFREGLSEVIQGWSFSIWLIYLSKMPSSAI